MNSMAPVTDSMREAIRQDDVETLAATPDLKRLHDLCYEPGAAEKLAEELGETTNHIRHLLYTAWFWGTTGRELGKESDFVPTGVKENLRWKAPVIQNPYAASYGII